MTLLLQETPTGFQLLSYSKLETYLTADRDLEVLISGDADVGGTSI
jgi:hypothetical protein